MANSKSWEKIFQDYQIYKHDFHLKPFVISAAQIKRACQIFRETSEKEVRLLCKQDAREDRPEIFIQNDLFLLPVKNGVYNIIKGEGYIDIPPINSPILSHSSILDFKLDSIEVGNSETQYLDFAYATSIIRTFAEDNSLILTIRGRKYTPSFDFFVGSHKIEVKGVQTEVDAGYEGRNQIVLIEAKNHSFSNNIIRQLFYPYRQWASISRKKITSIFFSKDVNNNQYLLWQFEFGDPLDYNSIRLIKSSRYSIC